MILPILLLFAPLTVWANTETCMFKIPYYYNIPVDTESQNRPGIAQLNESTYVIDSHPILDINNYQLSESSLKLPYDYSSKDRRRLLVKLNNYGNDTFDANDVINVKLCWPATSPFSFQLDHHFILTRELNPEAAINQMDIYVEVIYSADFYAVKPIEETTVPVILAISKLPNRFVPIPIELYDYILYAMDLLIFAVTLLPIAQRYIRSI